MYYNFWCHRDAEFKRKKSRVASGSVPERPYSFIIKRTQTDRLQGGVYYVIAQKIRRERQRDETKSETKTSLGNAPFFLFFFSRLRRGGDMTGKERREREKRERETIPGSINGSVFVIIAQTHLARAVNSDEIITFYYHRRCSLVSFSLGVVFFWLSTRKANEFRNHLFRFRSHIEMCYLVIIAKKTFAPLSLSLSICARNATRAPRTQKRLKRKPTTSFFCISLSRTFGSNN